MDALTVFVDRLSDPAPALQRFGDFYASPTSVALTWTDIVQDVVYQVISARSINILHGTSIILSPKG